MAKRSHQGTLPGMDSDEPAIVPSIPSLARQEHPAAQPDSLEGWSIVAVDAHSLIFQVFHAIPEMTSPRGEPVAAVYGFIRDILQLWETREPDAIFCAFDLPGPTFRHQFFDAYKAHRGEMAADLVSQIPKICEFLSALGIPVLASPGFEADDVLATLARQCDGLGANLLIVTGDKDCRQLITDRVSLFNIRKNEVYDAGALMADWGVRPDQVVDFQSLVGDKVDNVPGVPLIGPKFARELLVAHGTLENVLENAASVTGAKRRQNLINHRGDALLSKRLVRLDTNVPLNPDWYEARDRPINYERIQELCRELGFRSLGQRIIALEQPTPTETKATVDSPKHIIVDTAEKLAAFVHELEKQSLISIDTETTDIDPRRAEIVGYAVAFKPGEGYYLPVRGPVPDVVLPPKLGADALRNALQNPRIAKVGQNLKYDYVALLGAGIELAGITFDTMIASYLLESGQRTHNLDQLALRYLGHTTIKIETLIGTGKAQKTMDQVPVAQVAPYAVEDAEVALRLVPILQARLEELGLESLNQAAEVPLIKILGDMEFAGTSIDLDRLKVLSSLYKTKLDQLTVEIEELAGHPLNIGSPKQLADLLFSQLGLPVIKRTKTGPSTDASVLEELAGLHPLPAKIVEHRQYAKLLNTYVDALPAMVHPETKRVHASFNQVVAATGRLSSNNPNLQNIPIRTAEGRQIRSAFKAGPLGWKLLAADYSQIELRVLAHFSGDETLLTAFAKNEDIHTLVASQIQNIPLEQVDNTMRRNAKAVNFGIIYGQSPFGLAKALNISKEEAAAFIDTYFARYPGVLQFMTETLTRCRQQGYVSTILGRRRSVEGVRSVPIGLREEKTGALRQLNLAERTAVNSVIQGSAADMMKLAMIGVARRISDADLPATMLLQIHDELVFEVAPDSVDALARMVVEELGGVMSLAVPLRVDVKFGDNWAECESWQDA